MFFGYFAQDKQKSQASYVNYMTPSSFALLCIKKSLKQNDKHKRNIDIVAPFGVEDHKEIGQELIKAGLPISRLVLLNKQGNVVNNISSTGVEVRLLNPFPIPNHDIRLLLQISDPFAALTGDSSLMEGN